MLTRIALITAAVVLLAGAGFAAITSGDDGSDTVTMSLTDDGATVDLKPGDTLILDLEGNPTTGYTWQTQALDESVLSLTGEPSYVSDTDLVGSGGTMTFEFEAVAAGQTDLTLTYHRPWEDVDPIQTFTLSVNVG
jgi:inhibitor of cysteine peptidase